jgi:Protein of unknown function (DUF3592)
MGRAYMKSLIRIARRSLLLWFGAGFLAGGLVCLTMGIQWAAQEWRYQNEARTVDAEVLGKSILPASRQDHSSTRYEITYRFTTENGTETQGTDAVGVEQWESLDIGSTIKIVYLPCEPQSNRPESTGDSGSALAAMILGSIFSVVGGVVFVRSAIRVLRQWSILKHGDLTQATVLAVQPGNAEINNVRQWEVRYQYRDHHGRVHEGTSGDVAPVLAHAVAVGDTVGVRFDRDRPEYSAWIEPEAPATEHAAGGMPPPERKPTFWKQLVNFATMLALVFGAIIAGELLMPAIGLGGFIARHEAVLLAATIGTTVVGFALFMGGILYRIFGGASEAMTHRDVENLSRSMLDSQRRPYVARASKYHFKGKSAGASFHDQFSIKEAKEAWRRRAWRHSLRWRSNFVIMGGAMLLAAGLFSIFVVTGPNGVKFLCAGAIIYGAARTIIAFVRG